MPFSGSTREYNYETIATLLSYFIYAEEPWTFPVGAITFLAYPFSDANIGNVGSIPIFALAFKILGTGIDYFKTFDYFILIDILACFTSAYFTQKILFNIGVNKKILIIAGAVLTGTSLLLLNRSVWKQPFCIVSIPIYLAWMYFMLSVLKARIISWQANIRFIILFPVAVLMDGYAFFGIVLATIAIIARIGYQNFFNHVLKDDKLRLLMLGIKLIVGITLSYLALFIIGMYPMQQIQQNFSSYDFGMGGRYHVADLLSPIMPQGGVKFVGMLNSIPATFPYFTYNTDLLSQGQYEGIAYIGTPICIIWIFIFFMWIREGFNRKYQNFINNKNVLIYRPWGLVGFSSLVVFIFSLGYELHILGYPFQNFSIMPAALISDTIPSLYNIRTPGRLAAFFSLFLILQAINKINLLIIGSNIKKINIIFLLILLLHFIEIKPFLDPVKAQAIVPIGGEFNATEIEEIKELNSGSNQIVFFAPSVRAANVKWEAQAFSFAYFIGLKSNLYYIARTNPMHDLLIARDLNYIESGNWEKLIDNYGENIIIVIPGELSNALKNKITISFKEVKIGSVSVWMK